MLKPRTTLAMLARLKQVHGSERDHAACRADARMLHEVLPLLERAARALAPRSYGGPTTGTFICPDCRIVWGRGRWHQVETHNAGCMAHEVRGELMVQILNENQKVAEAAS